MAICRHLPITDASDGGNSSAISGRRTASVVWITFLKNNPMQSRLAGEDTLQPYCGRAKCRPAAYRAAERDRFELFPF